MNQIRYTPIAFESLGVRSMCTHVETRDVRILIDPGAALGPRFRLLPHPREYEALYKAREAIREFAEAADMLTVSHYHHDHFTPNFTDTAWLASSPAESRMVYHKKTVMAKDIRSSINVSQRRRGWIFQNFCGKVGAKVLVADGRSFQYGDTKVRFSSPLPHGEESGGLGWVLATVIEAGSEKLIHASDLQGPMSDVGLRFVLSENPSAIIVGGPPTYLAGSKVSDTSVTKGLDNLCVLAKSVPLVIVDHHMLRAQQALEELDKIAAQVRPLNHLIMTASQYVGRQPLLLEANRRSLYEQEPPSNRFVKWTKLKEERLRLVKPPVESKRRKRGEVSGRR